MAGGPHDKDRTPDIFIIAGESSGDELGASLIGALQQDVPKARFRGIGGPAMAAKGLVSLFPMADIAVMGVLPVLRKLPQLLDRIKTTAQAAIDQPPDVLVIIDSPDFTHRVARKLRAARPDVPIINYVSPTVWAWRPGRAKKMRPYVDHLLALLPFEPAAHARLGGPPCTYVGHPLIEQLQTLRGDQDAPGDPSGPVQLLVLPGSRRSEITRLMPLFRQVADILLKDFPQLQCIIPAVPHLASEIAALGGQWQKPPAIVLGAEEKYRAMRSSRAALAASGTVTLELALAKLPFVLAYKLAFVEAAVARWIITTKYAGLPNNILDRVLVPEFLQEYAKPEKIAAALTAVLKSGEARDAQLSGFAEVDECMSLPEGETPSKMAARIVLQLMDRAKDD
jgi:lipid-A-disaccharide synthase